MVKVHFIGRTFPEPFSLAIRLPELKWLWLQENLELLFRVFVSNSFVNIECELARFEPSYFIELLKRASDLAQTAVNLAAFATGQSITVKLETWIQPDGTPATIMLGDPPLAPICTAYGLGPERQDDLNAIAAEVATDLNLSFALNDLIETITYFHVGPVRCALAMDRIKHLIAKNENLKDSQAWRLMQDALQISEPYLKVITDVSRSPRHGRPGFIEGTITTDVTRRAWTVMNRYLEYRKRGGEKPLPEAEFPLLT